LYSQLQVYFSLHFLGTLQHHESVHALNLPKYTRFFRSLYRLPTLKQQLTLDAYESDAREMLTVLKLRDEVRQALRVKAAINGGRLETEPRSIQMRVLLFSDPSRHAKAVISEMVKALENHAYRSKEADRPKKAVN
jgi:plasmid stability protein